MTTILYIASYSALIGGLSILYFICGLTTALFLHKKWEPIKNSIEMALCITFFPIFIVVFAIRAFFDKVYENNFKNTVD